MKSKRFLDDAERQGIIVEGRVDADRLNLSFMSWALREWLPAFWSLRILGIVVASAVLACASHCFPWMVQVILSTGKAWLWMLGALLVGLNAAVLPEMIQATYRYEVQEQYLFNGLKSMLYHFLGTTFFLAGTCFLWGIAQEDILRPYADEFGWLFVIALSTTTLFSLLESWDLLKGKIDRSLTSALVKRLREDASRHEEKLN